MVRAHSPEQDQVSIVIPTFNSSETLEKCLLSIQNQSHRPGETIVVDTQSRDDTVNIAKRYGCKVVATDKLRSAARNLGLFQARFEFLIFVDSDMELGPNVLAECVQESSRAELDGVMIPEIRVGEGFWAKCRALERATYVGNPLIESARFFRRDVLLSLGGFDENLEAGEDWDLHARLEEGGYRVGSISSPIVHNEGPLKLKMLVRRRYYYGSTIVKYIKKNPRRARIQFLPIRIDYITHWRLLASQPLYAVGMFFMKFVENLSTGVSVTVSLLQKKT